MHGDAGILPDKLPLISPAIHTFNHAIKCSEGWGDEKWNEEGQMVKKEKGGLSFLKGIFFTTTYVTKKMPI